MYCHVVLTCSELMESLVIPLQEQIDEWKKTAVHLDKDHSHGVLTVYMYMKFASSIICTKCVVSQTAKKICC